jgi:tetratricopeptide (TPR) repeat protein
MSEEKKEGLEIAEGIDKAEHYVKENKKSLGIISGAIVLVVLAYVGYTNLILKPQEEEARKQMFMAEQYFGQDSINLALSGDGKYPGFDQLADEYSSAPSGNLSQYYKGMSLLRKGEFEKAIESLKAYDAEDDVTGSLALGGIGSAYLELGNNDEALNYFRKAADWDKNAFTRPLFLMKSAFALEQKKDFKGALEVYQQIKKDFPLSTEARDIDKYIGRAEAMGGAN